MKLKYLLILSLFLAKFSAYAGPKEKCLLNITKSVVKGGLKRPSGLCLTAFGAHSPAYNTSSASSQAINTSAYGSILSMRTQNYSTSSRDLSSSNSWDHIYDLSKHIESTRESTPAYEPSLFEQLGLSSFSTDCKKEIAHSTHPDLSENVAQAVDASLQDYYKFDKKQRTDDASNLRNWIEEESGPYSIKLSIFNNSFTDGQVFSGHTFVLEKNTEGEFHLYQSFKDQFSLFQFMDMLKMEKMESMSEQDALDLADSFAVIMENPEEKMWTQEKNDLLSLFLCFDGSEYKIPSVPLSEELRFEAIFNSYHN